jgi:hypothetical protein
MLADVSLDAGHACRVRGVDFHVTYDFTHGGDGFVWVGLITCGRGIERVVGDGVDVLWCSMG